MKAIGHFRSRKTKKLEAPRQPGLDAGKAGEDYLELDRRMNNSLQDIEGFSHLWLIFQFHEAKGWKEMVQPPRGINRKVGVFASRSPYRPNSLGLSLVKLQRLERTANGPRIYVEGADLIDGTPVWDIKPYVPQFDSVDESDVRLGWMDYLKTPELIFFFREDLIPILKFLEENDVPLKQVLHQQLGRSPLKSSSKRVKKLSDTTGIFSYRLWRVHFEVRGPEIHILQITNVFTEDMQRPASVTPEEEEIYRRYQILF